MKAAPQRRMALLATVALVLALSASAEPRLRAEVAEWGQAIPVEQGDTAWRAPTSDDRAHRAPRHELRRHWSFFARPGDDPRKVEAHRQRATEVRQVNREALGYALCLMGAVAFDMSLFYLTNFHREEIRQGTWRALNMTVSIFSSVIIYGVIRTLLMDILEPTHHGKGIVILNLALLGALYLVMQVVLFYLKDSKDPLALVSGGTIFGHMAGFAAMFGFGGLMMVAPFQASPWTATAAIGLAGGVIVVFTAIAAVVREFVAKADDGVIDHQEEQWMEQVEETENDVLSLCLGFMIMQVARYAITGNLHSVEPEEVPAGITQMRTNYLLLCSLVFTATTFGGTWLVEHEVCRNKKAGHITRRYAKALQNVSSMAMAWCLLAWGEFQVYALGFSGVRISGCMVIALLMTALGLLMIFVLDLINDRFMRANGTGSKSLRSLELALGVVVGFAWELAFDIALEEISRGLSFGLGIGLAHQFTKHLMPLALVAVVLPAWHTYVLPKSLEKEV